jgi:hypothetical protein
MKKEKKRKIKRESLLVDEALILHKSNGNGILKRRVWVDEDDEVTRYSLAYINHHICARDNGRVLGYDNAHNYHHRHHMGETEPVGFKNFKDIEIRFQQEFEDIHEKFKKKR